MKSNVRDIMASAAALAVIGGVVTAALAGTNQLTRDTIAGRNAEAENAARQQVITADSFKKAGFVPDGGKEVTYYIAEKDGETVGYVFTASVTGKSAGLAVMTGVTADGAVSGVKVTDENETAGYVDKVEKAGFLNQFTGKKPNKKLALGTDVDGVSQATKTSRGITEGVNRAVAWYELVTKGGGAS